MAGPSSPSSSSSSCYSVITPFPTVAPSRNPSMKLKNLVLETLLLSQMYRMGRRALNKAKALLLHLFRDLLHFRKATKRNNNLIFGSFRLYYNWCSTTTAAIPTWNSSVLSRSFHHYSYNINHNCELHDSSADLSRYLQWLEEKGPLGSDEDDDDNHNNNNNNNKKKKKLDSSSFCNEIDRLADLFIANCHEKFRLEKQESYRMFQEMMARSV